MRSGAVWASLGRRSAIAIGLALAATCVSVLIIRYEPGVVGNLCPQTIENPYGLCFESLPVAGYPFSFWHDIGGVSVQGQLGAEDMFLISRFVASWLVWSLFFIPTALLIGTFGK